MGVCQRGLNGSDGKKGDCKGGGEGGRGIGPGKRGKGHNFGGRLSNKLEGDGERVESEDVKPERRQRLLREMDYKDKPSGVRLVGVG